jgi:hypothetical protein
VTIPFESLEIVLAALKQMENTLANMKQLRGLMSSGPEREILDGIITGAELQLNEIRRKVIQ